VDGGRLRMSVRRHELADGDATQLSVTRTPIAHVTFLDVVLPGRPSRTLSGIRGLHNPFAGPRIYGIGPINVLNATDLCLAENSFHSVATNRGRESLIPIHMRDSRMRFIASTTSV
jgi:hypothetical protein